PKLFCFLSLLFQNSVCACVCVFLCVCFFFCLLFVVFFCFVFVLVFCFFGVPFSFCVFSSVLFHFSFLSRCMCPFVLVSSFFVRCLFRKCSFCSGSQLFS